MLIDPPPGKEWSADTYEHHAMHLLQGQTRITMRTLNRVNGSSNKLTELRHQTKQHTDSWCYHLHQAQCSESDSRTSTTQRNRTRRGKRTIPFFSDVALCSQPLLSETAIYPITVNIRLRSPETSSQRIAATRPSHYSDTRVRINFTKAH